MYISDRGRSIICRACLEKRDVGFNEILALDLAPYGIW